MRQAQQVAAGKKERRGEEQKRIKRRRKSRTAGAVESSCEEGFERREEERDPPRRSGDSGEEARKERAKEKQEKETSERGNHELKWQQLQLGGNFEECEVDERRGLGSGAPQKIQSCAWIGPETTSSASARCIGPGSLIRNDTQFFAAITDGVKPTTYYQLRINPHYAQQTQRRPYEGHRIDGQGVGHDPSRGHRSCVRHAGGAFPCSAPGPDGSIGNRGSRRDTSKSSSRKNRMPHRLP